MERTPESGFPIDPVYDASKLTDFQPEAKLGRPGEYPFTRGAYPRRYVDRSLGYHPDAPPAHGEAGARQPAAAIERGFRQAGIGSAAYQVAREMDEGNRIVVGVNKCAATGKEPYQRLRADATLGEVCDVLRDVWGEHHPREM